MFKASQPRDPTSNFLFICTGLLYVLSIQPFASGTNTDSIFDAYGTLQKPDIQERPDGFHSFKPGAKDRPQIYKPTFVGLDRVLLGRASPVRSKILTLNVPASSSINGDEIEYWTLPFGLGTRALNEASSLDHTEQSGGFRELLKREEKTLYITLSLCDQPSPRNSSNPQTGAPPPLELYISTNGENKKPSKESTEFAVPMDGGFGNCSFPARDDVYFSVGASASSDFAGDYTYELTASVGRYYALINSTNNTLILDSDSNSTLLASEYLPNASSSEESTKWMTRTPPYSIFVYNQDDPAILGIQKSLCGLKKHAQVQGSLETGIIKPSEGRPMQYFYVQGLNASTKYYSIIAIDGKSNNTTDNDVGAGGTVWNPINFTTRSGEFTPFAPVRILRLTSILPLDMNCAIIYNLSFCTDTAYAVPYNPNLKLDNVALAKKYDERANRSYQNFSRSLQQIPCNTPLEASYSLVRNCTHCAAAYKAWLCAVTIPRCQDFSSSEVLFQPRSLAYPFWNDTAATPIVTNREKLSARNMSARNPWIDQEINPGPWKEVLPCRELCYNLVRSCPASLRFSCPQDRWLKWNYGDEPHRFTCNDPTMAWRKESAASRGQGLTLWLLIALVMLPMFLGR